MKPRSLDAARHPVGCINSATRSDEAYLQRNRVCAPRRAVPRWGCRVPKFGARPEKLAICRQDPNFCTPHAQRRLWRRLLRWIAAEMAAAGPDTYISDERGPTRVSSMSPVWAKRAERAVMEGRRPANNPRVVRALDHRRRRDRGLRDGRLRGRRAGVHVVDRRAGGRPRWRTSRRQLRD